MNLFARAEQAAGKGFAWVAFYPTPRSEWTVVLEKADGSRMYLAYDATTDSFRKAEPLEDPCFLQLGDWMAQGRLLAYRVGLKATVEVLRDSGVAYAKILTDWKFNDLDNKVTAAGEAGRSAQDGFPRFARVIEADRFRAMVFTSLAGTPLSDVLLGPADPRDALRTAARSLACFHRVQAPAGLAHAGSRSADLEYRTGLVAKHFPERTALYEASLDRVRDFAEAQGSSGRRRLVHNDLHDGNVILDGDDVGLLDLEYLGAGDPCDDIGNLLAHLVLRAIQKGSDPGAGRGLVDTFLAAYREAGGELDATKLAMSVGTAFHRLSCLHLFRRTTQHLSPALLLQSADWSDPAAGSRIQEATRS